MLVRGIGHCSLSRSLAKVDPSKTISSKASLYLARQKTNDAEIRCPQRNSDRSSGFGITLT